MAILLPIFVYAYTKKAWVGHFFVAITSIIMILAIAYVCLKYGLRAGPFAEENWELFARLFQKPFFKIGSMAMGVTAAYIYMQILKFRRIPNEAQRKAQHPIINFFHHSNFAHFLLFSVGFALVLTNLLIGHSAIAAPYSWTMT